MTEEPAAPPAWTRLYPRASGPWAAAVADGRWATFDPESRRLHVVDPLADDALPGLAAVAARGALIAYRAGRRAVVATDDGYIKVVRPKRVAQVVAAHEWLASLGTAVRGPAVLVSHESGWFEMADVGGRSLHQILRAGGSVDEAAVMAAIERVGSFLATLHRLEPPAWSAPAVPVSSRSWAQTVGRFDPDLGRELEWHARKLPHMELRSCCVVHGDLHDKNVFLDGSTHAGLGLIDLDGLALGAAEDDVANLAVHLHLRALQAGLGDAVGAARARHLVGSYRSEGDLDDDRLRVAARHTWFRLSCLYRFRPVGRACCDDLLLRSTEHRQTQFDLASA